MPIYFTIQPGDAYATVPGSSGYQRGARLVYPNYSRRPAGALAEFWHYEPEDGRSWYVYGQGAVTADGRQVAPNPGVSIHEFTGAMAAGPALGGGPAAPPGGSGHGGDPVHLGTGVFVLDKTDLQLPDVLPIGITRTYRTLDTIVRSFGIGATHQFDIFLVGTTFPYTYLDVVLPNGSRVHFPRISPGTGYADAVYEHTSSPTSFFKARISWNGAGWNLDLKDGSRMVFRDGFLATRPAQAGVTRIQDRFGNAITLIRNSDADLTRIVSPHGRWIELTYDTGHRVTQAKDNGGRTVGYTYDASGRLWKVTDPANGVTEYTYDTSHRMLTLKDARGIVYLTNHYDGNGRVDLQTQADSTTFQMAYTLDAQGRVEQADLTDPRGQVRRVTFDAGTGYLLTDTAAYGTSLARTTTLTHNSNNQVTRVTDGLGRHTDSTYDSFGNVTSVTRLAGTGNAVTTNYTYNATFNLLTGITDPLNHTTTFTHNSLGNVTAITDPLSHQTTFTYGAHGLPLTATTAAGTTTFTYEGADLVGITDPLGRTTTRFIDAMGRLLRTTNPLGQTTTHSYDALNAVTQTVDAHGSVTAFTYDANRNLLTLTDALNHTTTYTYDTMDRVETRADPLSRGESYVYDDHGNLLEVTDRKGQVTAYTYDALDRLGTVTYDDTSTTTYTYDAGDRLTQVVDSLAGTITRTWDLLDRLTQEVTPEGTINYTYDAADRRATMTVTGQPQVAYGYDNADRLTSITQNSATVGFTYDDADRRTVLTLPNGVTVEYGYNSASQVTGLTYKLGTTTIGNLAYTYDLAGNRTSVGGTWARTALPTALTSATYDAANQIATWESTSFSYDLTGNLTGDGSKTYTWNARNQLAGLSGGVSASFAYDGLGRRRAKTVGGATTGFLYDGLNGVQELVSGSPSANILPGLGIDEWLTRADSTGTRHFLTDIVGSTVGLVDGSGTMQTEYSYEPFGKATLSGTSTASRVQFTGREDDGTGLAFHRTRYYNPDLTRFISEDAIGHAGGINLHGYVGANPVSFTDRLGLDKDKCKKPPFPPGASPDDNTREAEQLRDLWLNDPTNEIGLESLMWWFYYQVKPGGPMDYKQLGYPLYEAAGNFNFGAVGGAVGFSLEELLRGAGAAQWVFGPRTRANGYPWGGPPYGDFPGDQDWIRRGFDWYKKCRKDKLR